MFRRLPSFNEPFLLPLSPLFPIGFPFLPCRYCRSVLFRRVALDWDWSGWLASTSRRCAAPRVACSLSQDKPVGVLLRGSVAGVRRAGAGGEAEMPDADTRHTVLVPRRPPPDVPSTSPPFDGGHRRQARTPTTAGGVRAGLGGARRRARGPGTEARAAAAARTSQGRDVGARRRDGVRQPVTLR